MPMVKLNLTKQIKHILQKKTIANFIKFERILFHIFTPIFMMLGIKSFQGKYVTFNTDKAISILYILRILIKEITYFLKP